MTTEPILLHSGFDGLDMAYNVQIGTDLHRALLGAKAEAAEARRAVALTFRGVTFLVETHGGRGGYTFSVDTGVMGANWWFKEPRSGPNPWGARVSSRSLPLAMKGIEAVKEQHDQFLIDLGILFTEVDRRISRLDYAIDFLIPDFEIDPANFISHARRSKSIDGEFTKEFRGEKLNGIRIGKMPNSQICIYDKRREILDKIKPYWWDIWRENLKSESITLCSKSPIWRFEFRAGGKFIEKAIRRKTWEAFVANPSLVFEKIAFQTRLTIPKNDTNRTRWPSSDVWCDCQKLLSRIKINYKTRLDTQSVLAVLFQNYLETISAQTIGLIISQMCANGLGRQHIPAMLAQLGLDTNEALNSRAENLDEYLAARRDAIWLKYRVGE
jgi:hypothetical protein